jgi:hypothetical protein
MNCGLRNFGDDVMQFSYRRASICANFSFNFLKKLVRNQRWPTAVFSVVNISPSFAQFMAPLRHILTIHNVTINSNSLFRWTFTFVLRNRMTERTSHLAGLSIGAVKRALLTGKGSRSTAVLPQKHKKFPNRSTSDVSLLSGHVSHLQKPSEENLETYQIERNMAKTIVSKTHKESWYWFLCRIEADIFGEQSMASKVLKHLNQTNKNTVEINDLEDQKLIELYKSLWYSNFTENNNDEPETTPTTLAELY